MQRTISKRIALTYLDSRLNKCDSAIAAMQLESYYTTDEPPLKIGAINPVTRTYAYNIGDTVNVEPKIVLSNICMLTNIVYTDKLLQIIEQQR